MNRMLAYGYVTLGFLIGVAFGVGTEGDPVLTIRRLVYFLGALGLILVWQWFEISSHKRHLAQWEVLRTRGKWSFIASHYLFRRGILIFLLIGVSLISILKLSSYGLLALGLTFLIALVALAFLGFQEWSSCEHEFEVQYLRRAAQQARESSMDRPKDGT